MARLIETQCHSLLRANQVRAYGMDAKVTAAAVKELSMLGIHIPASVVKDQVRALFAGDSSYQAPVTAASMPTPLQFLQQWLPGFVKVITAARKIDAILGVKTVGSWEDQEIVQGIIEPEAIAQEYGDYTNTPLTSWNPNFERRTIVRSELGMQVFLLEEARAATMRIGSAEQKRQAAAIGLEQLRNAIGFYGWSSGNNRTFGFLNEPGLLPFNTVAGGAWSTKTFLQITNDIRIAIRDLRVQSQDLIDPETVPLTLVLPTSAVDFLSVTSDFGVSVRDWLTQTYPKISVVSAPELSIADPATGGNYTINVHNTNGSTSTQTVTAGTGAMYLFAESIDTETDGSTDGGETFAQLVQTKFMTLGVRKDVKSYVESYANATAGVLCKRPWAVVRYLGV